VGDVSAAGAPKSGDAAAEQPTSRNSTGDVAGDKSADLAADTPPQPRLGDQSYQESRLRKFNAIISKNVVDLAALEQVRRPSVHSFCVPTCLSLGLL
jgi:hypothetical protein